MCNKTQHFPPPFGDGTLTMGDIYDRADQELISKVMLEEKVFDTWHSGRTMLLGDGSLFFFERLVVFFVVVGLEYQLTNHHYILLYGFSMSQIASFRRSWYVRYS